MPRSKRSICTLALLLAGLAPARSASADDQGQAGRAVRLNIQTQGSEKYASYHGSVSIHPPGSAKAEDYYWGGSTCPAQKFTDAQVHFLAVALADRRNVLVAPVFRMGQGSGGKRCLVAFDLVAAT